MFKDYETAVEQVSRYVAAYKGDRLPNWNKLADGASVALAIVYGVGSDGVFDEILKCVAEIEGEYR